MDSSQKIKELCIFEKGVKNGWTVDIFPKRKKEEDNINKLIIIFHKKINTIAWRMIINTVRGVPYEQGSRGLPNAPLFTPIGLLVNSCK